MSLQNSYFYNKKKLFDIHFSKNNILIILKKWIIKKKNRIKCLVPNLKVTVLPIDKYSPRHDDSLFFTVSVMEFHIKHLLGFALNRIPKNLKGRDPILHTRNNFLVQILLITFCQINFHIKKQV